MQSRRFHSMTVILCLAWVLLFLPGSAAGRIERELTAPDAGHISGYVVDSKGTPLADIWVTIYVHNSEGPDPWQQIRSEDTNADGTYFIEGMSAGTYRIGFRSLLYYTQYYDHVETLENATDVIVTESAITPNINAHLAKKAEIHGRVTDSRGLPLAGVTVDAYDDRDGDGTWQSTYPGYDTTDDNGEYQIEGLEEGIYRVGFRAYSDYLAEEYYDNVPTIVTANDIKLAASAIIQKINAQLEGPVGRISGKVTDETGAALAGAYVALARYSDEDAVWYFEQQETSADDGSYLFTGLPNGAYRVGFIHYRFQYKACPYLLHLRQYYTGALRFDDATTIFIDEEQIIPQINAQLIPASHIQGRVTDDAGNRASASVIAIGVDSDSCYSTSPNIDGSYDLGVGAEPYKLIFWTGNMYFNYVNHTWEYYDNVASLEAATVLTPGPWETISGIDAVLGPPGTIRGKVTGLDGQGLAQIQVTAYQDVGGNGTWQPIGTAQTDAAGGYAVPGVGPIDTYDPITYHIGLQDLREPVQYHALFYSSVGYVELGDDILVGDHEDIGGVDMRMATIDSVNFAPLARADLMALSQQNNDGTWYATGSVLNNDRDAEDDPLTATLVTATEFGTLTFQTNGTFQYSPASDAWVSDSFTYRATDGTAESATATVTIFRVQDQLFLPVVAR